MSFQKFISKSFFKIFGWKIIGEVPKTKKYVLIIAPHTSLIDVPVGKMYNWLFNMKVSLMIKKEFFFFPMGILLRKWGGMPINRNYPGGIVKQMADKFEKSEELILSLTPEGTRSPNPNWKTGFHRIATAANVPVYLTFINFKTKEIGFLGEHKLTGDVKLDIDAIKERYRGMEGFRRGKFVI